MNEVHEEIEAFLSNVNVPGSKDGSPQAFLANQTIAFKTPIGGSNQFTPSGSAADLAVNNLGKMGDRYDPAY